MDIDFKEPVFSYFEGDRFYDSLAPILNCLYSPFMLKGVNNLLSLGVTGIIFTEGSARQQNDFQYSEYFARDQLGKFFAPSDQYYAVFA